MKVRKIIEDAAEQSPHSKWRLVLTEEGQFAYTCYKSVKVGDEIQVFSTDEEFVWYIYSINGKITKKAKQND